MKIGILSDTHKKVEFAKDVIEFMQKKEVDHIIHAGDIEVVDTLDLLEDSNIPYTAVLGNNDFSLINYMQKYNLFKEPHYFNLGDIKVKLMHLPYYLTNDANLIVYGHTHKFATEVIKDTLFINPGEVCARKRSKIEFCILKKVDKKWKVRYYHKEKFSKENFKMVSVEC